MLQRGWKRGLQTTSKQSNNLRQKMPKYKTPSSTNFVHLQGCVKKGYKSVTNMNTTGITGQIFMQQIHILA